MRLGLFRKGDRMKIYPLKLGTGIIFLRTSFLITQKPTIRVLIFMPEGYFNYYICKNSGQLTLMISVSVFCPLYCCLQFVSSVSIRSLGTICRQNGDRKETKRRQENVNDFSQRVHWKNFYLQWFLCNGCPVEFAY